MNEKKAMFFNHFFT